MARVAVAVSGGADSLFALISLREQGHEVIGVHGLFLQQTSDTAQKLQTLCAQLNINIHIFDLRKEFDALVIKPFVEAYALGFTPNPCSHCNAHIKFGLLMQKALTLGVDYYATGHYAKVHKSGPSPLCKGFDIKKEQSYFLALVQKNKFAQVLFPLEQTTKAENIKFLQERGIEVPVQRESQEICFVPQDAYRPFLQNEAKARGIALPPKGAMIIYDNAEKKKIGQHEGLWQYTEGQRRGLGIAWKEPLYVKTKDMLKNELVLGPASHIKLQGCVVENINFLSDISHWPADVLVRVRYRQQEVRAKLTWQGVQVQVDFHTAQSPTACGQVAVFYDEHGYILGGGVIKDIF